MITVLTYDNGELVHTSQVTNESAIYRASTMFRNAGVTSVLAEITAETLIARALNELPATIDRAKETGIRLEFLPQQSITLPVAFKNANQYLANSPDDQWLLANSGSV